MMDETKEGGRLLKLTDAAARLNVSRGWVWAAIRRGDLPTIRVGKLWRISEEDLETYLRERRTFRGGEARGREGGGSSGQGTA